MKQECRILFKICIQALQEEFALYFFYVASTRLVYELAKEINSLFVEDEPDH